MKLKNVVLGANLQIKRKCRGSYQEKLSKGLIVICDLIDEDYLRVNNPNIQDGWAWVHVSNVRKYKEQDDGQA